MSFLYIPVSRGSNGVDTFVGIGALSKLTTGVENSAFGYAALTNATSASSNVAVGNSALYTNDSGDANIAIGVSSLFSNLVGSNNIAVGKQALQDNFSGTYNIAIGQDAMRRNSSNGSSIAIGTESLYESVANDNTALGTLSGRFATSGGKNTLIGSRSGYLITTGAGNTVLGRFNGNQGGLDIRTASNYIVLSDGDGNPRLWSDNTGAIHIPGGTVFPSGTPNGVLYLNGSKVATSGSALTFDGTTVAVNSGSVATVDINASDSTSTSYLRLQDYGVTRAWFASYRDGSGKTELNGNGFLVFGLGGSEQMRLTSTGLGIGTSSPSGRLEAVGDGQVIKANTTTTTSTSVALQIGGLATTSNSGSLIRSYVNLGSTLNSQLAFEVNGGTEAMRLDSSGNLGLGVTPSAWGGCKAFELSGVGSAIWSTGTSDMRLSSNVYFDGTNARYAISNLAGQYRITTGVHQWFTAPSGAAGNAISFTQAMTLDANGNLSLGTTATQGKLNVVAGLSGTYGSAGIWLSDNATTSMMINNTASGVSSIWASGALGFGSGNNNNAEKMRLSISGNLGLGGSADRATTDGTAVLNIFNGTAPVGTLANGISIYSNAGEAYVMDAAGNATLFSPHDAETNEWIFKSKHTPTGKVLKIDVERLLRFVNDHFGLDAVQEFVEA